MGRWLKKSRQMHNSELTKPTEPSFVSFVSTPSGPFEKTALSPDDNHHELQSVELQSDPLAGLNLLPGDQRFIDDLLHFTTSQQRLKLLNGYREQWKRAAAKENKEFRKSNRARFVANSWLREIVAGRHRSKYTSTDCSDDSA